MRLAFMGSPAFAVPALHALAAAGHQVAAVYCQPPRPAHRGQALTRCAVHIAAEALRLEVRTPARVRRDAAEHASFAALGLDAAVVAAYGLILPAEMLAAPRLGCLNVHASLLPRWRGAAPIHAAVLAGDAETGITIMQMGEGLDTGAMLLSQAVPIGPRSTTPELYDTLAALGGALAVRALAERPAPVPQPQAGVTYAAKLSRADGRLDFALDAASLDRQVRALVPWPGTFATFGGEPLKVLAAEPVLAAKPVQAAGPPGRVLDADFTAACGQGALRLLRVQRPGRPAMDGTAFLRGVPGWQDMPLAVTRWALALEYDGTGFVGWQRQATGPSVQSVLEDALARLEGRPVASVAAGRTDAGVHALAQVAHADLQRPMAPERLVAAINYHLKPHRVAVLRAAPVLDAWSARFSATGRAYRYAILNRPARAALQTNRAWHIPVPLDVAAMQQAAQSLLGRHDFTSFRASACQAASPLRTLDRLDVARHTDMVEIVAEARSFLHHQVRNMVGTLRLVGDGRWQPADMARVLAARDRKQAGPTAPPGGLFLTGVRYGEDPFA